MQLIVKFNEFEFYDITRDERMVTYMATTSAGSYFAEAPVDKAQVKRRKQFKEKVIELMQKGLDPGEIEFEDDATESVV